jgi:hypothetical protein
MLLDISLHKHTQGECYDKRKPVMANHNHVLLIKTKISYKTNFIHI